MKRSETDRELHEKLRGVCLALPEVGETVKWGNPTFVVGTKIFAVLDRYGGRPCIAFRAPSTRRATLLRDARFFAAPYDRQSEWLCMHADIRVSWRDIGVLLRESYRIAASAGAGSPGHRRKTPAKPAAKPRRKSGA